MIIRPLQTSNLIYLMFALIRKFLFLFPAETAHYLTLNLLKTLIKVPGFSLFLPKKVINPCEFAGIKFPNPVGLAAGFDKNAKYLEVMKALGFGHVEIGTVTPKPQDGNPKPRLFRLKADHAIINRMGFNNDGVEVIKNRLKDRPSDLIVGGNIGKNKVTPNENAIDDYLICFRELYAYVDYFTVNVSSPNTPGLRELQDKEPLTFLLKTLIAERVKLELSQGKKLPVFLKIAPDLTQSQLDDIIALSVDSGIDGIVSSNTTLSREGLKSPSELQNETGGLSGKPVKQKADEVLEYLCKGLEGKIPVMGVGGIHSSGDAKDKFEKGAGMVQLYTGFIYEGPKLVNEVAKIKRS